MLCEQQCADVEHPAFQNALESAYACMVKQQQLRQDGDEEKEEEEEEDGTAQGAFDECVAGGKARRHSARQQTGGEACGSHKRKVKSADAKQTNAAQKNQTNAAQKKQRRCA
jgi:hypothetical protein